MSKPSRSTKTSTARRGRGATPIDPGVARSGRWLVSGTPHLTYLAALGGVLCFLAFTIGGSEIATNAPAVLARGFDWTGPDSWAAALMRTGSLTLDILTVAIAGCIAHAIADRPGVIPGVIGGLTAVTLDAGYLGGLTAGLIAGAATRALGRINIRRLKVGMTGVLPLVATVITAVVLFAFVGPMLSWTQTWLTGQLIGLEFSNQIVLGLILGLLMCCDLGGAIGKTAFGFGTMGISSPDPSTPHLTFMAVVMATGMVPPLGMALATLLRRSLFSETERRYGRVSWLSGLAFVPEGAVPFALTDPLRVIPANMAGGAVTGVVAMKLGPTAATAAGGVFAATHLGKPLMFAAAVAAGTLVTAGVAVGLKSLRRAQFPALEDRTVRARVALAK
ncbi:fructose-specific PTS transporter subunit EIIC [Streptomyces sp. NPDC058464]|uniref:fructose-specific PTS transporter subunit EIIC n=1 Tax=Streptomyces sp. NPDC058464 TaxID=3346511 RepID=UPI0036518F4D